MHDAFRRMLCEFTDTERPIQTSYEEMENLESDCPDSTLPRNHRQNWNAKVYLNGWGHNSKIVRIQILFDIVEQGDFSIFNFTDKWRWDSVDFIPGFPSVEQCSGIWIFFRKLRFLFTSEFVLYCHYFLHCRFCWRFYWNIWSLWSFIKKNSGQPIRIFQWQEILLAVSNPKKSVREIMRILAIFISRSGVLHLRLGSNFHKHYKMLQKSILNRAMEKCAFCRLID